MSVIDLDGNDNAAIDRLPFGNGQFSLRAALQKHSDRHDDGLTPHRDPHSPVNHGIIGYFVDKQTWITGHTSSPFTQTRFGDAGRELMNAGLLA